MKFKKAVEKGDEAKVLEIYNKHTGIRRKLNANAIVNEDFLDTYMHVAAKNGMVEFLKLLLYENRGDPNKLNRNKETVLHKICQGSNDSVQYECLQLILQWHNLEKTLASASSLSLNKSNKSSHQNAAPIPKSASSNIKHCLEFVLIDVNINAKDLQGCTALHYAAKYNLPACVQKLISQGAYLFIENLDHCTPCDLAEQCGCKDIALFLESKMLFSKDDDEKDALEDLETELAITEEKQNYGLRIQDLQEEKDTLLLETSQLLRCNVFTAEILLKKHEWSKEALLRAWREDPKNCCEKCGISSLAIEAVTASTTTPSSSTSSGSSSDKKTNAAAGVKANGNRDEHTSDIFKFKLNKLDYHSNVVIARKLSGRYMKKNAIMTDLPATKTTAATTATTLPLDPNQDSILKETNYNNLLSISCAISENNNNNLIVQNASKEKAEDLLKENTCDICLEVFVESEAKKDSSESDEANLIKNDGKENNLLKIMCGHKFCRLCLEQYLTMKIEEGNVIDIVCPAVDCFAIIPKNTVESLISKVTVEKYLQFDLKAFVDSNPSIKWCPFPGCGMAVKNPRLFVENSENVLNELMSYQQDQKYYMDYSKAVDCGSGHYFCWDCLQEGHEPASCQNWKDWFQKILEIKPEELCNTNQKEELTANNLWLVTNSKRCPNQSCNAPIQKNEGCNHVKCYKCKHDFCWICLEPWKKHSSSTGGYFQCNKYEISNKIMHKEKALIAEAEEAHQKTVELNKFVHYYTRFKNHELSYKIEEPLLAMAKTKFEILIAHQQQKQENKQEQEKLTETTSIKATTPAHQDSVKKSQKTFSRKSSFKNSTTSTTENNSYISRNSSSSERDISSSKFTSFKEPASSNSVPNPTTSSLVVADCNEFNNNKNEGKGKEQKETDESPTMTDSNAHIFIEEAIAELLRARRILRCSYVYGYFLDTFGHKKFIFEFIQTEFEEFTENLSQIIARPHLKTPKNRIIRLTNLLKRKRIEFSETIIRGLNSFNDTPPTLKKYSRQRWKYLLKDNIQNDDEFKNNIAISLKELNPKNPWIVDKKGRHTNLLALLNDWPELEHELDSILVSSKDKTEICSNKSCSNHKAINTLSGSLCNYCSIKCMREDHNNYVLKKNSYKLKSNVENVTENSNADPSSSRVSSFLNLKNKSLSIESSNEKDSLNSIKTSVSFDNKSANSKNNLEMDSDVAKKIGHLENEPLSMPSTSQKSSNQTTNGFKGSNNEAGYSDYTVLPYESIFLNLNSNQNDISVIIKNMDNVLNQQNEKKMSKVSKVCNFEVKIKK